MGSLLLLLYIVVALCNYSVVQSYLGRYVGSRLSAASGGEVSVGALYVNPLGQVVVKDALLVSPTNDTLANLGRLAVRFNRFPLNGEGLSFDVVTLSNTYYHFATIPSDGSVKGRYMTNLQWLIKVFASDKEREPKAEPSHFIIKVKRLNLRGVHYKMDLATGSSLHYPYGVDIPHMDFQTINARFKNVRVDNDYIDCRIVSFSAEERSGFALRDLSGDVSVSPFHIVATNMELITDSTRLLLDAALEYENWGMSDYCNDVMMTATIRQGSIGGMSDAAYWAPAIWGVDERVGIEGYFKGTVADMLAQNVVVSFGDESRLYFDGKIVGLPYIGSTTIDAEIHSLHTTYSDLAGVHHPPQVKLHAEKILQQLDVLDMIASFHGDCHNWVAAVDLSTPLGNLAADASVAQIEGANDYSYKAEVESGSFDLGQLFPNEWVTRTGLSLSLQGRGTDAKTLKASAEGQLLNTQFRSNSIDVATIAMNVEHQVATLTVDLKDTLVDLALNGTYDFTDTLPGIHADIDLQHCNLTRLHLLADSEFPTVLSSTVVADFKGLDLDAIKGQVTLDNTHLLTRGGSLDLDHLSLSVDRKRHDRKVVHLNSDWVKADVSGYFKYENFPLLVRQFCDAYLPMYYNPFAGKAAIDESKIADHYLNLDMRWVGAPDQLALLIPNLKVSTGSSLHCSYNYTESFKLLLRSDSINYGTVAFHDLGLRGLSSGSDYGVQVTADRLSVGSVQLMDNLALDVASRAAEGSVGLKWGVGSAPNRGDIELLMVSDVDHAHLSVVRPTFFIDGARWTLSCPDGATISDGAFRVDRLKCSGDGQSLALDAVVAHRSNDRVDVSFSKFQLDKLVGLFIQNESLAIGGVLEGGGSLKGLGDSPYFNANATIDDFTLGGNSLGVVTVKTYWNAELNQLNLNLTTSTLRESGSRTPLYADGYIELGGKDPAINFNADFDQFDLATVSSVASSFSSDVQGFVSGEVDLSGTFSNPDIKGGLYIDKGSLLLDITGVRYHFSDSVFVADNNVRIKDFLVTDSLSNKASINGYLDCSDLNNISTSLRLKTNNILALSKSMGESFYGTLLVSADAQVRGPISSLLVSGKVRTNPGSRVVVPISDRRQVSDQDFITFVSESASYEADRPAKDYSASKLKISAEIAVTPDLSLEVPLSLPQMDIAAAAAGEGDLHLDIDGGAPRVTGSYEITSGSLELNLAQLASRKFNIQQGSSLAFPGPIADTRFDISAVYSLRTNISSLTGGMLASESSQRTISVEDIIQVSGTADAPKVSFDIRLPNADQSVQDEVFAYIDRTSEKDMLNQTFSLLVLGQFSNASATSTTDNVASGYQMVANTMGNLVSKMVGVVDVNFDYRAATELTTEQYELDISKEWNKLYFESSFGYGGTSRDIPNIDGANNLVGDMLVGYKLSPRVHLFMFNRTNTNDYTRTDLPYRQGMGLKVTKDFNHWSELFKSKKK